MGQGNTITVRILDKEYQVACPEDQQAELVVSAKYLDKQMRSIRDTGKVIGLERIAVMAALNISYELLQASEQDAIVNITSDPDDASISQLNHKVDDALYQLRQLEIS
ncbi:MAG: cell division protein ZapA [Halioglobus sp.]